MKTTYAIIIAFALASSTAFASDEDVCKRADPAYTGIPHYYVGKEIVVEDLYIKYLHRQPRWADLQVWATALKIGAPEENVRLGIACSHEATPARQQLGEPSAEQCDRFISKLN